MASAAQMKEWADAALDNCWTPPASEVARAIQYPSTDPMFVERVVNAYARDAARLREKRRQG